MTQAELSRLLPHVAEEVRSILDAARGEVEPPIRSEIFGPDRFAQHGRSLGETHRAEARKSSGSSAFFPRLRENIQVLREAQAYIGTQARSGYQMSPAAEWLLDNFHLIESQLKEIHDGLPRSYFRDLPVLVDEPLAGLPRIYGVAWAFVAHTDGAFDDELIEHFLKAYQETRALTLGELWALPTTLRVLLVENLRRLAERLATNKAAREIANVVCDRLDAWPLATLDELLGLLQRRGVARVFLVQVAQRLQEQRGGDNTVYRAWLQQALPDLAAAQVEQPVEEAADNLSVSNAIGSLRLIGNADWPEIISNTSATMQLMLATPTFASERSDTRDETLHEIETLARRSGRAEAEVARQLLDLMNAPPADGSAGAAVASHWLYGGGRPVLLQRLALQESLGIRWQGLRRRIALPAYLGSLAVGSVGLVAWITVHHRAALPNEHAPLWLTLLTAALMLFPASEAVVALINRLISESARPRRLPRLALAHGIPPEHRVLVVIPGMLTSAASASELAHRLELHHLANPEPHAQFALLTDCADATTATLATDEPLLAVALKAIDRLNIRYPRDPGHAPRFILLHRDRVFSETEQRWIGWERKRGKLEQLIALLADPTSVVHADRAFRDLGDASRVEPGTPYLITLDGDTQLPPGRLRDLVGVAAHPHNQPRVDAATRTVTHGYGILQPRVATPLPAPSHLTLYHWLFAGQCGIDPYSAASSEVYQDLFDEGTFTGKGLLNVQAMHAVMSHRLPDGRVLSHDLLEGSLARCAAVTDVTVIEEAPFHADVAASRVHRWTRGDWQLLPFLFSPRAFSIRAINRWKMLDNLRRSLVAPMSLALLVLALASGAVSPVAALGLIFAAFVAGPMMGAIAAFAPSRDDIAKLHFYRQAATDLWRGLGIGLWLTVELLEQGIANADAVIRTLWRLGISRRHLLQWTTAASAQASAATELPAILRKHLPTTMAALSLWLVLLLVAGPLPGFASALCFLWAVSPAVVWWVSRPLPPARDATLPAEDQAMLEATARDTWRLFERCVDAGENHLPPDNLQLTPHAMVAHRTSPTNIGLYLLSTACARQFGWIGTTDLIERLEATLQTLDELPRHRGHFLNWYDTQTKATLLPMYVSTVDSGNLSGHLLAVGQACRELAREPFERAAVMRALHASHARLATLSSAVKPLADSALARALALTDPLHDASDRPDWLDNLLRAAATELGLVMPPDAAALAPTPLHEFAWRAADHLATLRSALLDARALETMATKPQSAAASASAAKPVETDAARRLRSLAERCEAMAWQPDYGFLYHRKRHLLHIGYRVADQQLDTSFYDLLASESRLTSLLAIAKGDVPVSHWAALGRPFYAVGAYAGLRSWSGSMFEYLMPSLVLDEPHGSVLSDACQAALREQCAFGREQHVPWGISESAYAASDHTLAYQYAPQGVPRLALRRTPHDELVVAPYATALAVQIAPHLAVANFAELAARKARARYGFIEALDFSGARQSGDEGFARVDTFMAHHQGMSIVAIANALLDGTPRRWGMGNAHVEAVASLLHERAPREVSVLLAPPMSPSIDGRQRRAPGMLREVDAGMTALTPTHLMSNGRYSVSLRANGAGWSRWGNIGIARWRDDALRDQHGSFFYLRWDKQPQAVSLTQHPAPDPAAHYRSTYHADRVCFDATWSEIEAHTTVWVSPEDDVELREVELRNLTDRVMDLELMSAFEVTLADTRADESHPAFSNLFLRAHWRRSHRALVFERKPRLPTERSLHAAHFIAGSDLPAATLRVQPRRLGWLGRNRSSSHPLAAFDALPAAPIEGDAPLDTGLDPMCALSVRIQLAPRSKVKLTFCTAASDNRGTLDAVIDKYHQQGPIDRASMMSATLNGIRLRELNVSAESFAAIQTLNTALVLNLTRPRAVDAPNVADACDRRVLWRFGISGDRPILLVFAGAAHGLGLLRSLTQALRIWSWAGVACDLVVLNSEPSSYLMALQRDVSALREQFNAQNGGHPGAAGTSFHVLRADEVSAIEQATLRALARVQLNADGRPLAHHVDELSGLHEAAIEERQAGSVSAVPVVTVGGADARRPQGRFMQGSGEFHFEVSVYQRPARPWVNVLANPGFGAHISEGGGGYSWGMNSRLNQLTPWSNDPVADTPGEWFLLQDLKTRALWSVTPSAWGDDAATYRVAHGQGYSIVSHRRGDLEVTTAWCVDAESGVKQVRMRLVNRGHRTLRLRAIGMAEWIMGADRGARATTTTSAFTERLTRGVAAGEADLRLISLSCTQLDRSAGFGEGTAFFAVTTAADESADWTCDRRECFDARGRLAIPDHFGQRSGPGLDPCAALSTRITLPAGESAECAFLLGFGANPVAARQLATDAASVSAMQRMDRARAAWDALLGTTVVKTPDPLFDAMVNRWLLYQAVACRLWAKAGFYQAGGAFGFRDQLQDAMALAWAAPAMLREQIVLNASRQFAEGDVQHWWHAPTGAGVRTHFSDDLLWLPYACAHYVQTTGDASVLDDPIAFIEGGEIPAGAEDAYYVPAISAQRATVYEHAARTIDRSLALGTHGLPLMGTGDWNDGMNRVGSEGRGESVWLAWFLCSVVEGFAPIARRRGETARAERWEAAAAGWRNALLGVAWDGSWFKRAFFDDGSPLGSHVNTECRIDLIAQAWSVMSKVAPLAMRRIALASMDEQLIDRKAGLVRLLDPPLQNAEPSAGYIQAYPKGVRENGGQYSHAGVWALIAQAMSGDGDAAYRYFGYLSPAHRSADPDHRQAYEIEPYVMAGDVYSAEPYVGRGGWSWYTGSAAWLHRAAIEHMFGMTQRGSMIEFNPCLPSHWDQAEIRLTRGTQTLRVILHRPDAKLDLDARQRAASPLRQAGVAWRWDDADAVACVRIELPRLSI